MSRAMSFQEFRELLEYIEKNNSPLLSPPVDTRDLTESYPRIKYIDPAIDMRTQTIFSLKLRSVYGTSYTFHTVNEYREIKESLVERVMLFLNSPSGTSSPLWICDKYSFC